MCNSQSTPNQYSEISLQGHIITQYEVLINGKLFSIKVTVSTLGGGGGNLRNASVTFSLFWHEASLG